MATRATSVDPAQLGATWTVNRRGSFTLRDSESHPVQLRGRKARAIVAYLNDCLGECVARQRLIELLWIDRQQAQARCSLRQSLAEIRREAPGLISSDTGHVWIDPCRLQETSIEEDADDETLFDDLDGITAEFDEWLRYRRQKDSAARWSNLQWAVEANLSCGASGKALPLIERMQRIDPYNEDALRLAMRAEAQSGHPAAIRTRFSEMEQRLKKELGIPLSARTCALHDELLVELSQFSPPRKLPPEHPDPALKESPLARVQRVAFARASDGVTLAYSCLGDGPPLVRAANFHGHLEHEMESPLWRHWTDELSRRNTLLRYDQRGTGMSDWSIPELTFDLLVEDLATVVDAAGWDRFDLVAISQGTPVAIAFAARYPERVDRLVLINGFSSGWRHSSDPDLVDSWEAMCTLARTGWGKNTPSLRQVFTRQFLPSSTAEQSDWWNELQRRSATPENAYGILQMFGSIDVSGLLGDIQSPTLVLHCKDDQLVAVEAGRFLASKIPGAEFLALDGSNHLPQIEDPSWPQVQDALRRFFG